MIRTRSLCIAFLLAATLSGTAHAQEEAHYEGYSMGSNPNSNGSPFEARGVVTALYPPLPSNFVGSEYTWVIAGLNSLGSVLQDSVYTTIYLATNSSTLTIWEDPCQDARPTFNMCPADIVGHDPRYADNCAPAGGYYLRGHFTFFMSTFNIRAATYGQGTFSGTLNWDSGTQINSLTPGHRGSWHFGGSTTSQDACIPPGYQQALTGRIFQATTDATTRSWGQLRKTYR